MLKVIELAPLATSILVPFFITQLPAVPPVPAVRVASICRLSSDLFVVNLMELVHELGIEVLPAMRYIVDVGYQQIRKDDQDQSEVD